MTKQSFARSGGAFALAAMLVALTGCDLFGSSKPPLPGERVAVSSQDTDAKPDPDAGASGPLTLPKPVSNDSWPQSGGFAHYSMQHLALADAPQIAWTASVGAGSTYERQLLAPPIVAEGRVFVKDALSSVSAFDAATGALVWRKRLEPKKSRDADEFGGGLAFYGGRLFVTTGFADVFALNPATGDEIWRAPASAPVRGAPTVFQDRVLSISIDSRLQALAAVDGSPLWDYSALSESAAFMAGASAAAAGEVVVAPFSSGELVALRLDNGRQAWNESLVGSRRGAGAVAALTDIRSRPVIDGDRAIAIGSAGQIAAVDLRSGTRLWDRQIAGAQTPWVAGGFIFIISGAAEVICLNREDGKIRWVTPLTAFKDEKKKKDPLLWSGPVLAGDRLLVAGSNGELLSLSPYDGKPLGKIVIGSPVLIAPIVADRTAYVLTDSGRLIAIR
ncbi:MAG: PQQ-binding-like beta-propeller repeat protein [Rhodospirillales bacterium]|nr:MAG: PQQ-binding-like beta-propeller repeat protein [Rhodospirillales bacterium]